MTSIRTAVLVAVASLSLTAIATAGEPTTRQAEVDRDTTYTVIHNPDGSTTVTRNTTATNENTGKTATRTDDVTVTQTDDGHSWTRDTDATGPNGTKVDSHTDGQSHTNPDGSKSWDSHTDGTVTGESGRKWIRNRDGKWTRSDDTTNNNSAADNSADQRDKSRDTDRPTRGDRNVGGRARGR